MRKAYDTVLVPYECMPKQGYRTVTVTQNVYDILQRLKEQVALATQKTTEDISFNDIINIAVKEEDIYSIILERAIREFMQKRNMEV